MGSRWAPISLRERIGLWSGLGSSKVPRESRCWGAPGALGLLGKQHAGLRAGRLRLASPGSAPLGKALGPAEEPCLLHDLERHWHLCYLITQRNLLLMPICGSTKVTNPGFRTAQRLTREMITIFKNKSVLCLLGMPNLPGTNHPGNIDSIHTNYITYTVSYLI